MDILRRMQQVVASLILLWNIFLFYFFATYPMYVGGNDQIKVHETLFQAGLTPAGAVWLLVYVTVATLFVWYGWQTFVYQRKVLRWMWFATGFMLLYSLLGMMTIGLYIAPAALLAIVVSILGSIGIRKVSHN